MLGIFTDETGQKNKGMKKDVKRLNVLYSEQTFRERMGCIRGGFQQNEGITFVTQDVWDFPEKERRRLDLLGKSNRSDSIGAMSWVPWANSWQTCPIEKKVLMGANRVDVGGPSGLSVVAPTNVAGKEVVFFHCMSEEWYNLLLEDYPIDASIDTSPGQGDNALAHIRARKPYLGICMTKKHCELLVERLVCLTFGKMMDETDTMMYDPQLAALVLKAKPASKKQPKKKAETGVEPPAKQKKQKQKAGEDPDKPGDPPPAKGKKNKKEDDPEPNTSGKKQKSKAELMSVLAKLRKGSNAEAKPDEADEVEESDEESEDSQDVE
jgi:hypothetical protein